MKNVMSAEPSAIRLTTQFGDFEASGNSIVSFADGLPGFERCRRFVVLRHTQVMPLVCLHAVDGPQAAFLAVDPRRVLGKYRCVVSEADRLRLGAAADTTLLWLSIITIADEHEFFANLRAPVIINPERLVGIQAMPQNALYPLRHRIDLEALAKLEAGASCS
jgi:flagellar assembly factor FliW